MHRLLSLLLLLFAVPLHAQTPDAPLTLHARLATSHTAQDTVAVAPDGSLVATGGRDNLLHLWDATTGEHLRQIATHTDWVTSLIFSPDGTTLYSASRDGSVRVIDVATGQLQRVRATHDSAVLTLALSDTYLASAGRDGVIYLHAMSDDTAPIELTHSPEHDDIRALAFAPEGDSLAASDDDGNLWLWDVTAPELNSPQLMMQNDSIAVALAFSPDGSRLLTAHLDNTLRLWDTETRSLVTTLEGHDAPATSVHFLSESIAASASLNGMLHLWNVTDSTSLLVGDASDVPYTGLAAHNESIAAVSAAGELHLWQVDSVALRETSPSTMMTFTPHIEHLPEPLLAPAAPELPAGEALAIPSADIQSSLTSFPLGETTWDIDAWEPQVGHFAGTATLNQRGNIVLGGHAEYPDGTPGIFHTLTQVGRGDTVLVQNADNQQRRYTVIDVRSVHYREVSVVYPTPHRQLTLITCDIPSYNPDENAYDERLVVIAVEL